MDNKIIPPRKLPGWYMESRLSHRDGTTVQMDKMKGSSFWRTTKKEKDKEF